jgi:hypothetical protein
MFFQSLSAIGERACFTPPPRSGRLSDAVAAFLLRDRCKYTTSGRSAKMAQSMISESQSCSNLVLDELPNLAPAPHLGPDVRSPKRRDYQTGEFTRRQIAQVKATISDFERRAREIEGWIQVEQDRSRIHDPAHIAYSTAAKALTDRRERLNRSVDELKRQLGLVERDVPSALKS